MTTLSYLGGYDPELLLSLCLCPTNIGVPLVSLFEKGLFPLEKVHCRSLHFGTFWQQLQGMEVAYPAVAENGSAAVWGRQKQRMHTSLVEGPLTARRYLSLL